MAAETREIIKIKKRFLQDQTLWSCHTWKRMQYLNITQSPLAPSSDFFGSHSVNLSVKEETILGAHWVGIILFHRAKSDETTNTVLWVQVCGIVWYQLICGLWTGSLLSPHVAAWWWFPDVLHRYDVEVDCLEILTSFSIGI